MNHAPKTYTDDPSFRMHGTFLPDDVYTQALEAFVVVCTDVVIINKQRKTFYLAKRNIYPLKTWWMIGGRMLAGETPLESMQRCFKRETGLEADPSKFSFVTMNRYILSIRKQEPRAKGSDTLAHVFAIELTDQEIKKASTSLHPDEYDATVGLVEFTREKMAQEKVFNAIVDLYNQVFI